jgi:uncharacterized damage-inducible protein DinB
MELLDWLLGHDIWSTRQLVLQSAQLTDAQLDQPFDVDARSLRACFVHIIQNLEVWTELLAGRDPERATQGERADDTIDGLLGRLSVAGREFALVARKVQREGRLDDLWLDTLDTPPQRKTYGGTIAHVITHSMHHRAHAMYMLERLGVTQHIEGDVLSWEAVAFGWQRSGQGT